MSSAIFSIRSSESIYSCQKVTVGKHLMSGLPHTISRRREWRPLTASLTTGIFLTTLRSCSVCETRVAAIFGPLDPLASVAASYSDMHLSMPSTPRNHTTYCGDELVEIKLVNGLQPVSDSLKLVFSLHELFNRIKACFYRRLPCR